ncbi:hypothetical protein [Kribbella soli]|uniref:Uncharacterized protein n=1 Tax=Kribbella soli TaxID=1124743 RepID=A0A4R0GW00_9ACTN|nr:hypothetical protein [Kribbella soli]TCC01328.1 hypothetical protein E0H45_42165 [Kribbella soli]
MARTHRHDQRIELRQGEDVWPLFEQLERALDERLPTWGVGRFRRTVHVDDSGGQFDADTVTEARAELNPRHALIGVRITADEDSSDRILWKEHEAAGTIPSDAEYAAWRHAHSRSVLVFAVNLNASRTTPKSLFIRAEGPVDAEAIGLATVLADEVRAARKGALAPVATTQAAAVAPAQPRPWWKRAWSVVTTHPLIVTIGGTIVAGAILYWLGFGGS